MISAPSSPGSGVSQALSALACCWLFWALVARPVQRANSMSSAPLALNVSMSLSPAIRAPASLPRSIESLRKRSDRTRPESARIAALPSASSSTGIVSAQL